MYCVKCGTAIPEESKVCPACGAILQEPAPTNPAEATTAEVQKPKKRVYIGFIDIVVLLVCIALVFFFVSRKRGNALKNDLTGSWYSVADSITKVLEIGKDEIVYRVETGNANYDKTIETYEWKAIGSETVLIKRSGSGYTKYTFKLSDDKAILTVKPALTSGDPAELWFRMDD